MNKPKTVIGMLLIYLLISGCSKPLEETLAASPFGFAEAQYNLGLRHYNLATTLFPGEINNTKIDRLNKANTYDNYKQAVYWFQKAGKQGHVEAGYRVGGLQYDSGGLPENIIDAVEWNILAAEQGYSFGEDNLFIIGSRLKWAVQDGYIKSRPILDSMIHILKQDAEQGSAFAQYHLGVLYYYGSSGDFDPAPESNAEAVKWLKLGVEQGDASCQAQLAYMYSYGYGVTKDSAETRRLYTLAAKQRHANAQWNLNRLK